MNMAIDEALLSSKMPVLRLYQWKPAGLSIGYFQSAKAVNTNFCKKNNIEIVRRLTGGNAVLHDKELTYSFIIDERLMPKSVIESYKEISKGLLQGLRLLRLNPEMNDEVEKGKSSDVCFNDPSWYEILVNKKKIVGSAQRRVNGKLLQHGAILMDIDVKKYANCFKNCSKELISALEKRMTSINGESKEKIDLKKLKFAMKKGFEQALGIEFIEDNLTKKEISLSQILNKEKYSTKEWNFMR
jgi:lipoate-protein ligase A